MPYSQSTVQSCNAPMMNRPPLIATATEAAVTIPARLVLASSRSRTSAADGVVVMRRSFPWTSSNLIAHAAQTPQHQREARRADRGEGEEVQQPAHAAAGVDVAHEEQPPAVTDVEIHRPRVRIGLAE